MNICSACPGPTERFIVCALLACSAASSAADDGAYVAQLESERRARSVVLQDPVTSPLGDAAPDTFSGLSYFVVDPQARRDVRFIEEQAPAGYRLPAFDGGFLDFVRVGYLQFAAVGGEEVTLALFQRVDEGEPVPGYGLVPFRDRTNGVETYAGGRYIEVALPLGEAPSLDFNRAVNPLCAYDPRFACPVPPAENRLEFRIEAGEKRYQPAAD